MKRYHHVMDADSKMYPLIAGDVSAARYGELVHIASYLKGAGAT